MAGSSGNLDFPTTEVSEDQFVRDFGGCGGTGEEILHFWTLAGDRVRNSAISEAGARQVAKFGKSVTWRATGRKIADFWKLSRASSGNCTNRLAGAAGAVSF
jgi:hypothetical protein